MQAYNLDNYTYEDYLAIDKSTPESQRYELIFGYIYAMSGASAKHQDVVLSIAFKLKSMQKESDCLPRVAPFDLKIECASTTNIVQPDVILYCNAKETPCAVFEVLSPSTAYKDKSAKKDLYECAEIINYFLVDPLAQTVEKFILENGKYIYERCYGLDDVMYVECLNSEIKVIELFD